MKQLIPGTQGARHPGGRPRVTVDLAELHRLRDEGRSWRAIGLLLGIGTSTALSLHRGATARPDASQIPSLPRSATPGGRVTGARHGFGFRGIILTARAKQIKVTGDNAVQFPGAVLRRTR